MKAHIHWRVLTGEKQKDGSFSNYCLVNVQAKDEAEAIAKAKLIVKKKDYVVREARECFVQDSGEFMERAVEAMEKMNPKEPWE